MLYLPSISSVLLLFQQEIFNHQDQEQSLFHQHRIGQSNHVLLDPLQQIVQLDLRVQALSDSFDAVKLPFQFILFQMSLVFFDVNTLFQFVCSVALTSDVMYLT